MKMSMRFWIGLWLASVLVWAQPYSILTIAGRERLVQGAPAAATPLGTPVGLAGDRQGNLYLLDLQDSIVLKVNPAGAVATYAGSGLSGFGGDGGPAAQAFMRYPQRIALDSLGNMYIADNGNCRLRKVDPSGVITTIAGDGSNDSTGDNGPAKAAKTCPEAVAVDTKGNIYLSEAALILNIMGSGIEGGFSYRVRMIDPSGVIKTVAGTGLPGYSGDNGPATSARIGQVSALFADAGGNLYLCDNDSATIRKVTPDGTIRTVAGNGQFRYDGDGRAATATAMAPIDVAGDSAGNLYFADFVNYRVRRIAADSGIVTTVAGNGQMGFTGDGGPATAARIGSPSGVWVDSAGNLYFTDEDNGQVRKIAPDGKLGTVAGAPVGDNGPARDAFLYRPVGVATGAAGNIYIADTLNNRVRLVKPNGDISTVAGTGYIGLSDGDGRAVNAMLNAPHGVAVDATGNLYIADAFNYKVRKVTADGRISTLAGTGKRGYSGDGGMAGSAQIGLSTSVAVDPAGNVYFTDIDKYRIRKVSPAGNITTIAGNGKRAYAGDGGLAVEAPLHPVDVCLDREGSLYVADQENHRIRKITADGVISTVAGNGTPGYRGDGGPATSAQLRRPAGVAVDRDGNLFIADYDNYVVRMVTPKGIISTIAGNGRWPFAGDGGPALSSQLDPIRLTLDERGNLLVVDRLNSRIRRLSSQTPALVGVVSGSAQSGVTGEPLNKPLVVRVTDSNGVPVQGVTVVFAVTAGAATLGSKQVTTGADGTASSRVTLGSSPGDVTITATVAGLPVATFRITAKAPASKPLITPGSITGAGGSVPPVQALSPNGLAIVLGENFAPPGTSRTVTDADLTGNRLPTNLAGACVLVADKPASVLAVQPGKITFQAPPLDAPPATVEVRVAVNCGTSDEVRSNAEAVAYRPAAPEFLYFLQTPEGKNPIKAVNTATGTKIGLPDLLPGETFVPAAPGDTVTLQAVGLGATNPPLAAGEVPGDRVPIAGTVDITVAGVTVPAADVSFAGMAPGNPGIYLLEIKVPGEVQDGDAQVVVSVDGIASPLGGYLAVRREAPAGAKESAVAKSRLR